MANVKSVLAASAAALTAFVVSAGCSTSAPPALCHGGAPCVEGTQCAAKQSTCISDLCGNGERDANEACDDGGVTDGDVLDGKTCNSTCTSDETCGNGIRDFATGEACDCKVDPLTGAKQCDPPTATSCSKDCLFGGLCGNGATDGTEACDQGSGGTPTWGPTCNIDCTALKCGDGKVNWVAKEECDGGNGTNGLARNCNADCTASVCGDHKLNPLDTDVDPRGEQCDDGTSNAWSAACLPNCVENVCGDGYRNTSSKRYEDCDEGPVSAALHSDCPYSPTETSCVLCSLCKSVQGTRHFCGDGKPDPAEVCDQGFARNVDNVNDPSNCVYGLSTCELCSRDCQVTRTMTAPICGNLVRDAGMLPNGVKFVEQCDSLASFMCGTCSVPGSANACRTVALAKARGYITVNGTDGLAGVTLAVADDVGHAPVVFEFVAAGGSAHAGNIPIPITPNSVTATAVAADDVIGPAIASITSSATSNRVLLTNDVAGVSGNVPITLGNNDANALTATDMTGGVGCSTGQQCSANSDCVNGTCSHGLCN